MGLAFLRRGAERGLDSFRQDRSYNVEKALDVSLLLHALEREPSSRIRCTTGKRTIRNCQLLFEIRCM